MALKLSNKELNKILKDNNLNVESKPSKRTNEDRLNDAIERLSSFENKDQIFITEDNRVCKLIFEDVSLISNNASLRLGARKLSKYKSLWHDRVVDLVPKELLTRWESSKEKELIIEFLYEVPTNKFLDYDGRIAAFKAPLDGIIESGLIHDDSEEFIPLILGRQKKSIDKKYRLIIIISVEDNFDRFYSPVFLDLLKK